MTYSRGLERQAVKAIVQGSTVPMDAEVRKGEAVGGWDNRKVDISPT